MHDSIGKTPAMQVGIGRESNPTSDVIPENGDKKLGISRRK